MKEQARQREQQVERPGDGNELGMYKSGKKKKKDQCDESEMSKGESSR